MKQSLFIFFILCVSFEHVSAQAEMKTDSIYYLLDTARTPPNERMWDIDIEKNMKAYMIACPCLDYGAKPTLFYPASEMGYYAYRQDVIRLKTITLTELIKKAKQYTSKSYSGRYIVFLIEPAGEKYVIHQTKFFIPQKNNDPGMDYEILKPTDTLKIKKP